MIPFVQEKQASALRWLVIGGGLIIVGLIIYTTTKHGEIIPTPEPPAATSTSTQSIKPIIPGTSWQIQLSGDVDPTILDTSTNPRKLYDVDLVETPQATIDTLKAKGITVICYFSAGTAETYRGDYTDFPANMKGKSLADYPDEYWLDIRATASLLPIMIARMDLAVAKDCDGIDPDNLDVYTNDSDFPLSAADQLAYNRLLATEAHRRGLAIGLKNDIDQVDDLAADFDFAINEQCHQYNECDVYQAFIELNKAVFGIEYAGEPDSFCPPSNAANYDFIKKDLALGALPRTACRLN